MNNLNKNKRTIKKRSNKLSRAEKGRFSIIAPNLDNCVMCGKKKHHLHEIFFGTGKRQLSMKYGLVIPLCYKCHDIIHKEAVLQDIWHIKGQTLFEQAYPNLDFLEIFGENYK